MITRRALAAVAALACLLVAGDVASADASVLVFTCGAKFANLCESGPDGTGVKSLTTDATGEGQSRYASPSLSADGSKLAFIGAGQLFVLDLRTGKTAGPAGARGAFLIVRMRADGGRVAVGELAGSGGSSLCLYQADTTGRTCVGGNVGAFGWAPGGDLYGTFSSQATTGHSAVCLIPAAPTGVTGCSRTVLYDPAADLSDPVLSHDGSVIAVTRSAPGALHGQIAEYSASTGQLLRTLTAGPDDAGPVFSPDDSQLAFVRGDKIGVVSTTAAGPGTETIVADGRDVTWGGGSAGGDAKPKRCTVPKVTGRKLSSARAALSKAGCGAPLVAGSKKHSAGSAVVTKQSPSGGASLAQGQKVHLTTRA